MSSHNKLVKSIKDKSIGKTLPLREKFYVFKVNKDVSRF